MKRRLVLLGGGHAHVHVLDSLSRSPLKSEELVLISPYNRQIYSGMLPGWVAGHYELDECTISLDIPAQRAGCRRLQTSGVALDAHKREVLCADGARVSYDVLSIDVGAGLNLDGIAGASQHALPVRPLEAFVQAWERVLKRARQHGKASLAIVGGGAAGVELALAMQYRLAREIGADRVALTLASRSATLMPGFPGRAVQHLEKLLAQRGVRIELGRPVQKIDSNGAILADGTRIPAHDVLLATGPAAPGWLRDSGLALDERGFIRVDRYLNSASHVEVYAAGDIASMDEQPRPKSGVFAVRAGPPLTENLRLALQNLPPRPYVPQQRALYLIGTGDRNAIGAWGSFAWSGSWAWRWKERLDRRFVERYR
jgi:selenide,water dikinase